MKKDFLKKAKEILVADMNKIVHKVNGNDIQVDFDGDEADEVQANLIVAIHDQLNNLDKMKLGFIEKAIKRIDNDTFGLCEECEEEISEKRLMFNLTFTTCISCAEEREAQAKRRGE